EQLEESPHKRGAGRSGHYLSRHNSAHPQLAQRLKRGGRFFKRYGLTLGEPRHEQRHRGPIFLTRDQRLDYLGKRGGTGEPFAVLSPEADVVGTRGTLQPRSERTGDVICRVCPFTANHTRQVSDRGGRELVPPRREVAHGPCEAFASGFVACDSRSRN